MGSLSSVLSAQFFWKPKTDLKNSLLMKKKREKGSCSKHSEPGILLSPDQTVNSLEVGAEQMCCENCKFSY